MTKQPITIALAVLGWMGTAAIPFLTAHWYSEVFVRVADNVFANVKPIGVALSLVLAAILSLAIGGLVTYWFFHISIERIPKGYDFEKKGAILTRRDTDLCSKCFFQDRREIPLKENEKNSQGETIFECILKTEHQYRRWS